MSKIRYDFGQLLTLTTNISGTYRDIDKGKMALSTMVIPTLNKIKFVNFGPLAKKL